MPKVQVCENCNGERWSTSREIRMGYRSLTTSKYEKLKISAASELKTFLSEWLEVFGSRIIECACASRLPPWLLASVILGEVTAMDPGERSGEILGFGKSVGMAQITVDTAIKHRLTPQAKRYHKEIARVAKRKNPYLKQIVALSIRPLIRVDLLDPAHNICASADYLDTLLQEALFRGVRAYSVDRKEPWGSFDFRKVDVNACPVNVENASVHPNPNERRRRITRLFGAAHNDGALSGFQIGFGLTQGENAGAILDDLVGFGLIKRYKLDRCPCREVYVSIPDED